MDIKKIIKVYCGQLCAHRFDKLDEKYQFHKKKLTNITQEEIDHLNRPISIKEIESIINFLKQKAQTERVYW